MTGVAVVVLPYISVPSEQYNAPWLFKARPRKVKRKCHTPEIKREYEGLRSFSDNDPRIFKAVLLQVVKAVLLQVVKDIICGDKAADNAKWLSSRDYKDVCYLADIEPAYFRKSVINYLETLP